MNPQEEKIIELADPKDEIIVLEPKKDQSFAKLAISSFMNLPFTSKNALAERVRVNSYFLIRNADARTLYSMAEDLTYDSYDVSEAVNESEERDAFVFMGYKFKYVEVIE
ncbi:hypothetical protein [Salinicoccus sp. YB14-2]|uniref:hypothetical protein n=1 Tax=Salinicoccus sp. YB14-2 TaxID=1572701 RepID=UPI00068CC5F8|nr:hypothetical protein [Salinicoccus sp. YB14-2]